MRGRRFVRPTLTLSQKGAEIRALADLEHKPWAAEDGEVWTAAFRLDEGLDGARVIELSVAPDIAVELRRRGRKLARPGDTLAAGTGTRSSRFKEDVVAAVPDEPEAPSSGSAATRAAGAGSDAQPAPARRRRASASVELERLGARLAAANHALEQERERRAALAESLEEERTASRQLRTELGQARVELEVAATARAEATAVEAELDEVRRELREAQRRHEAESRALTSDHQQLTEAHATLQAELREQAETLQVTREALAAERAETGRLHNRLSQLQESRERGAALPGARVEGGARPAATRNPPTAGIADSSAGPDETQRFDVLGSDDEPGTETAHRAPAAPAASSRPAPRRTARQSPDPSPPRTAHQSPDPAPRRTAHPSPDPGPWTLSAPERLRPLNPSLRHRTWWLGRLLVVVVLCGVIVALYLVLHTTVLH